MSLTKNSKIITIDPEWVDLVEKKSKQNQRQTEPASIGEIAGIMRKSATAVLLQTGWTDVSGTYEQVISNSEITANSFVIIVPDNADVPVVQAAEILPQNEATDGEVKVFSVNEPTDDINVTLQIFL